MSKIMIGKYEGSIYQENGGWTGAVSLGFDARGRRQRIKRKGRTKAKVKEELAKAIQDREQGIKNASRYTVADAVNDWLEKGLKGRAAKTLETNRFLAEQHVIPLIGGIKLKELTADHVDEWLDGLTGKLSTRSLEGVHSVLKRSIRQAQARDKVVRNVAELVTTPTGMAGRPSKALTLDQAREVLDAARSSPLYGYVAVSMLTGIRTEEARALRWDHVVAWTGKSGGWQPVAVAGFGHRKRFAIYVWRSVRDGGDTKTKRSRRTLELPKEATDALRETRKRQAEWRLKAGSAWQDHGLVFTSQVGTPLDASHVRRSYRAITRNAGVGENWTPRELRHTFVSIMSDREVRLEDIADLVGHTSTATTEEVYRHQLKPVITKGAETINTVFSMSNAPVRKASRERKDATSA